MKPELKAVLAECNRIRATLGLPKRRKVWPGVRSDSWYCPIAKTIGRGQMNTEVGWCPYRFGDTGAVYSQTLIDFEERFDAGEYPELEAKL